VWERSSKMRIEAPRATTPANLDGMQRRIAYAKRKYHSGTMWAGVSMGLAGLKFSVSTRRVGDVKTSPTRMVSKTTNPLVSLVL